LIRDINSGVIDLGRNDRQWARIYNFLFKTELKQKRQFYDNFNKIIEHLGLRKVIKKKKWRRKLKIVGLLKH